MASGDSLPGTSTPFNKKSSDRFRDLHKLELLTKFDFNQTSFLEMKSDLHQNLSRASVYEDL